MQIPGGMRALTTALVTVTPFDPFGKLIYGLWLVAGHGALIRLR